MRFIQPLAWWLLLGLPLIVLLHLLRMRRRTVLVPSLIRWMGAPEDVRASTPSRRLRVGLLFWLQIGAFLFTVIALARPYRPVLGRSAARIVAILDVSASMQGTDVPPSRFEAARRALRDVIRKAPRRTRVALIVAGRTPQLAVPFTSDRDELTTALDAIRPTDAPADLEAAVRFAEAISTNVEADVYLFSDVPTPPNGANIILRRFLGENRNVLIERFDVERPVGSSSRYAASVRLRNETTAPVNGHLFLEMDGAPVDSRAIELAAGGVDTVRFAGDLPPERSAVFVAVLRAPDDLPADNRAVAMLPPSRPLRVLIVGEANPFLDALLDLNPPIRRERVSAQAYIERDDIDLTIFEGVLPERLPRGDLLLIDPPGTLPFAKRAGSFRPQLPRVNGVHPLVRFVDFDAVAIREATAVTTSPDVIALVSAEDHVLLGVVETDARRAVFSTFDLLDPAKTDFLLQPVAVVFFANLVAWTREGQRVAPRDVRAGDVVRLRVPVESDILVVGPDGTQTVPRGHVLRVEQAGIYSVMTDGRPFGQFAVNPAYEPTIETPNETEAAPEEGIARATARQELWRGFAVVALVLLLAEWWVVQRRT